MEQSTPLTCAVIICAYTEDRWDDIRRAVDSVKDQTRAAERIVLSIDYNPALAERCRSTFQGVVVVENTRTKGLSGTRNTAVDQTTEAVLVFLDDDAFAEPQWLAELLAPLETDPSVRGVGGWIIPQWRAPQPFWWPEEFNWTVGATTAGTPQVLHEIRNPFGCNAAWHREVFQAVPQGFPEGSGRLGDDAAGCEETELAIAYQALHPNKRIVCNPAAVIHHSVDARRATWEYFMKRCAAEGRSKAAMADRVGVGAATTTERQYVTKILAAGVGRSLRDAVVARSFKPAGKALAITAGLAATTFTFGRGKLKTSLSQRHRGNRAKVTEPHSPSSSPDT